MKFRRACCHRERKRREKNYSKKGKREGVLLGNFSETGGKEKPELALRLETQAKSVLALYFCSRLRSSAENCCGKKGEMPVHRGRRNARSSK